MSAPAHFSTNPILKFSPVIGTVVSLVTALLIGLSVMFGYFGQTKTTSDSQSKLADRMDRLEQRQLETEKGVATLQEDINILLGRKFSGAAEK